MFSISSSYLPRISLVITKVSKYLNHFYLYLFNHDQKRESICVISKMQAELKSFFLKNMSIRRKKCKLLWIWNVCKCYWESKCWDFPTASITQPNSGDHSSLGYKKGVLLLLDHTEVSCAFPCVVRGTKKRHVNEDTWVLQQWSLWTLPGRTWDQPYSEHPLGGLVHSLSSECRQLSRVWSHRRAKNMGH